MPALSVRIDRLTDPLAIRYCSAVSDLPFTHSTVVLLQTGECVPRRREPIFYPSRDRQNRWPRAYTAPPPSPHYYREQNYPPNPGWRTRLAKRHRLSHSDSKRNPDTRLAGSSRRSKDDGRRSPCIHLPHLRSSQTRQIAGQAEAVPYIRTLRRDERV